MTLSNKTHTQKKRLVLAICIPALLGMFGVFYAVRIETSYTWPVFLTIPFFVSLLSSLIYSRIGESTRMRAYFVSLASILALGGFILIFAVDGLICLLMAFPLAALMALPGSLLGHFLARRLNKGSTVFLPILFIGLFPFLMAFENKYGNEPATREVTTKISINAGMDDVWKEVIAFDKIESPPSGIFRMGIAYPIQAKIEGQGVGAIRHCIFSTGPFVEPITRWDPPHALEFSVSSNPPPMKELSPWGEITTPHLSHTFISTKGQFHLREESGRTILEGTTWYHQSLSPGWYWYPISDAIIHRIHLRVLESIKSNAENQN